MVVTFRVWQLHLRDAEQRAEQAEGQGRSRPARPWRSGAIAVSRMIADAQHLGDPGPGRRGGAPARKRGEDAPPALLAIQEAGADAVRELRATLGVLRSEEDGDGSGLSQLDSLVARARAAGLSVTVTVTGAKRPLPPEVDHRQDPRQPGDDQARRPRPGPARRLRLPDRPGHPPHPRAINRRGPITGARCRTARLAVPVICSSGLAASDDRAA